MREEYDFSTAQRGPVLPAAGKTRIALYLDNEVLEAFRRRAVDEQHGYQTLINQVLREAVLSGPATPAEDLETLLRRVIREELHG